jgi:hypothetical protein
LESNCLTRGGCLVGDRGEYGVSTDSLLQTDQKRKKEKRKRKKERKKKEKKKKERKDHNS